MGSALSTTHHIEPCMRGSAYEGKIQESPTARNYYAIRRVIQARKQNRRRHQVGATLAVHDGVREGVDALVATIQRLELVVGVVRVVSVLFDRQHAPRWQDYGSRAIGLQRLTVHLALRQIIAVTSPPLSFGSITFVQYRRCGAAVLESSAGFGAPSFTPVVRIVTVPRSLPPLPSVMVCVKVSPSLPLSNDSLGPYVYMYSPSTSHSPRRHAAAAACCDRYYGANGRKAAAQRDGGHGPHLGRPRRSSGRGPKNGQ